MPQFQTSHSLSSSDDYNEPNTAMLDLLDGGSPVPSLVDSISPFFPARYTAHGNLNVDGYVGTGRGSERWNSRSSAGSSRRSVTSDTHATSSVSAHRNNIEGSSTAIARAPYPDRSARTNPRPKIPTTSRYSMLSAASTASLHLQTPGLIQEGFPFHHSALETSDEGDEGEDGNGYDGGEDDYSGRARGIRSIKAPPAEGKLIAQRRMQFEAAPSKVIQSPSTREASSLSSKEDRATPIMASISEISSDPSSGTITDIKTADRGGNELPVITVAPASTEVETQASSSKPYRGPAEDIGLGLRGVKGVPKTGNGWQEDVDALVRDFEEVARSSRDVRSDPKISMGNPLPEGSSNESLSLHKAPSSDSVQPVSSRTSLMTSGPQPSSALKSPPTTPSKASSANRHSTIFPGTFSRSGSPFQSPTKTSISPSQSILNLNQKGLASARRQQWESSTINNVAPIAPLRLSKNSDGLPSRSGSPRKPHSLVKPIREEKGKLDPVKGTSGDLTTPNPSASETPPAKPLEKNTVRPPLASRGKRQENVKPQGHRSANIQSLAGEALTQSPSVRYVRGDEQSRVDLHRKAASGIPSSLSDRMLRPPPQASTMQSSVMAASLGSGPAFHGSTSSVDWMERTLGGDTSVSSGTIQDSETNRAKSAETHRQISAPSANGPIEGISTIPKGRIPSPMTLAQASWPQPVVVEGRHLNYGAAAPVTPPTSYAPGEGFQAGALSVRNPDTSKSPEIPESESFRPNVNNTSYFSYPTGVGISAVPEPQAEPTFALAKTYSDLSSPFASVVTGLAIPTSPDLNEQASRSFADRVYSKSPLSKSPGKGIMGRMVVVAKKAVPAGIKTRTGSPNRFMQDDRSMAAKTTRGERIKLDDPSIISLVPSAIQQQEEQGLRPQWGQENYLRPMASEDSYIGTQRRAKVDFPSPSKERELPPIPQGEILHSESSEIGSEVGGSVTRRHAADRNAIDGSRQFSIANQPGSGDLAGPIEGMLNTSREILPVKERAGYLPSLPSKGEAQVLTMGQSMTVPQGFAAVDTPNAPGMRFNQPPMDERGLSVFRSRQMPRSIPQLTTPALLGSSVTPPMTRKVVPPALPVSAPPPHLDGPSASQMVETRMPDIGTTEERPNDPSPTKTERFRRVASWAQLAAVAPPPFANEPQNDSQEAALRRDEDRLAVVAGSFTPPRQSHRPLPSILRKTSAVSHTNTRDMDMMSNDTPEAHLENQGQFFAAGHVTFQAPQETDKTSTLDASLDQFTQEDALNPAVLVDSSANDPNPSLQAIRHDVKLESGQLQSLPVDIEALQHLQMIHESVQALGRASEPFPMDGTFKEAVMSTKDQSDEILVKTNLLLEIISSIQQRLGEHPAIPSAGSQVPQTGGKPRSEDRAIQMSNKAPEMERVDDVPNTTDPSPEIEQPALSQERDAVETVPDNEKERLDKLVTSLEELKALQSGASAFRVEEQAKLEGYLQQLNSWISGLHQQLQGDMQKLHGNVQSVLQTTQSLGKQHDSLRTGLGMGAVDSQGGPEESQSLDLRSRLDHLSNMMGSIQTRSESQGIVASRIDHVIDVLSGLQNKPEPEPQLTAEELTAIVEQQNAKHVQLLRAIASDLIKDMKSERAQMVQELSAATAVEVERHVAGMNAELKEKRQELDRLESQRKEVEETISDLLRIQSRYKGPTSPSMAQQRPVQIAPARPMPGAMPVPAATPPRPPSRAPQLAMAPSSGRGSTRPLPTPSPRPSMH